MLQAFSGYICETGNQGTIDLEVGCDLIGLKAIHPVSMRMWLNVEPAPCGIRKLGCAH